jgi:hypothetical protein
LGNIGKINRKTPLGKIGGIKNCAKRAEKFFYFFFLQTKESMV